MVCRWKRAHRQELDKFIRVLRILCRNRNGNDVEGLLASASCFDRSGSNDANAFDASLHQPSISPRLAGEVAPLHPDMLVNGGSPAYQAKCRARCR
jgi:hypothetical protein